MKLLAFSFILVSVLVFVRAQKECNEGFYFDPITQKCAPCSNVAEHCKNCTNATTCTGCADGYVLRNGTCQASEGQDLCDEGFYLDPLTQECAPCSNITEYCVNCTNATTCTGCADGYVLRNGTCQASEGQRDYGRGGKYQYCGYGYYYDDYYNTCRRCSRAIRYCIECDSKYYCKRCKGGYRSYGGKCIKRRY